MNLVTLEEIKQLKYRYLRCLDLKRWDDFEQLFVEDCTGDYGTELSFTSRDELVSYMRSTLTAGMITLHQCHHPEISVDGDTATATWYLEDKVIVPDFKFILEGAAFYNDTYVKTADGWRIKHTGYRRTYEATYSTDAIAGYNLKVGTAYDG
jgi:hypothetical protein